MSAGFHREESAAPTERRPAPHVVLFWICSVVGVVAAIAILFVFGWSLWTAIAVAFLIACPTVIAWALRTQRTLEIESSRSVDRNPRTPT